MEKQKLRSEIEDKYKWDLTKIYNNDNDFMNDLENFKNKMKELLKYKEKIMLNSNNLYNCLELENELDCNLDKLFLYAHLHNDEDTTNSNYQRLYGLVINLSCDYEKITSFIVPELMRYEYKDIQKFYDENKMLKEKYEIALERLYDNKKYILDEKEEKLISSITKAFDNSHEVYSALTNSDFKFGNIIFDDGKIVEMTDSNYSKYISSKDRKIRKQAFELMYKTYKEHINSLAKCLSNTVESNISLSKIRGYESCLFKALHNDEIPISVYDNLINVVSKNLNVLFKYYKEKKNILKLDELHMYDIYVPLISEENKEYSFEEAKELVINSLSVLGEDYIKNLKKAFDEKWIDVFNNKGKRTGAYSSGSYGENPYLLLNFEGKLNDVSTLAHELGHSMHTYYSNKNNLYQYSGYSIFVAEVASTVNELLLDNYLLKTTNDKNEKKNILNNLLELYKGTLFRQTMFAEFEKDIYRLSENGEILTSELLNKKYYNLNKKYFKDSVVLDDDIKYEWARIPHFYYFFYVFKYATSICAATYIVKEILSGNEKMKEDYLKFLSLGCTKYPVDELMMIGVNMNDEKVFQSAIDYFEEILNEFIEVK